MTSEVIIDVQPKEISIALLEDKSLVEYQNEPREASFAVGNIYLGRVRKLSCTILIWDYSSALSRNTSSRYRATANVSIPSRKPPFSPSYPRTVPFRTTSRWARR